ncbi:MAG: hypothetical protein IPM18_04725 [Phycisphaerales bacterium]|nr:hypothetical protein [Phycisphaerales bacterium]
MRRVFGWSVALAVLAALPAQAAFNFRWQPGNGNNWANPYVNLTAVAQVKLQTVPGGSNGGPFRVELAGNVANQLPYYDSPPAAIGQTLFQTWCIESQINFSPNTAYWASVDPVAYSGGGGGGLNGDAVSNVSEWIYDQWKGGNLNAYNNNTIRDALWRAEGEGGAANAVYNLAVAGIGGVGNIGLAKHTWALNLWVMQWDQAANAWYATDVQSHLITIPAPAALLLGLVGITVLARMRRLLM